MGDHPHLEGGAEAKGYRWGTTASPLPLSAFPALPPARWPFPPFRGERDLSSYAAAGRGCVWGGGNVARIRGNVGVVGVPGLFACRVVVLSGCWVVGTLGCVGMLGSWTAGLVGCWAVGLLGPPFFALPAHPRKDTTCIASSASRVTARRRVHDSATLFKRGSRQYATRLLSWTARRTVYAPFTLNEYRARRTAHRKLHASARAHARTRAHSPGGRLPPGAQGKPRQTLLPAHRRMEFFHPQRD